MHQIQAIQAQLDRIELSITEPLPIAELAQDAGMSYWHFQRTFTAMVGDPIGRYIRRRRIAHAAIRLLDYDGTLLDLALDYQFESHEAFTRAFKSELSVTPSDWREGRGSILYPRHRERLTQAKLDQRYKNMHLLPEIVSLPSTTFVGLQSRFLSATSDEANNMTIIPNLWSAFFERAGELQNLIEGVYYGLSENPEALNLERKHPDEAIYLAAAQVDSDAPVPEGMHSWSSIGGLFSKFEHQGPVDTLGETIAYIYGKWFPESEYKEREGPDINRFGPRFIPQSENSLFEIFVPIAQT
ncbi:AraC family transcriptional regulator [Pelagicoccus sp. SDUM812002]|uniref:AraC family transcriptional regulator n=1 Tax=Pelagicoccus sp. SDUM812002 TaxID=3041266 RepID=UPI00280FCA7A|nr:AraC family transcriptional regulator [Pelagicoccus sp. SDUM812002]MDQ8185274.1 AraC family transcriptional regulator [Pelagicoccus sp. SDUM812002]